MDEAVKKTTNSRDIVYKRMIKSLFIRSILGSAFGLWMGIAYIFLYNPEGSGIIAFLGHIYVVNNPDLKEAIERWQTKQA